MSGTTYSFIWHQFWTTHRRHPENTSKRCTRVVHQNKRAEDWQKETAQDDEDFEKEVREYIKDMPLHHYLFQSRIGKNKPLDRRTVDWILKTAAIECGIENIGTHSMRKTFGYHYYKKTKDVAMLMDLFNHSSPAITLRYIGIRQDQRDKAMSNFDL